MWIRNGKTGEELMNLKNQYIRDKMAEKLQEFKTKRMSASLEQGKLLKNALEWEKAQEHVLKGIIFLICICIKLLTKTFSLSTSTTIANFRRC